MKRILIIQLLLSISVAAFSQEYYVLQVKGTVKKTKTGQLVKTKDVIKADEQLTFSGAADAVSVVNPKAGRFVIKPGKSGKSSELLAYVKDAMSQASSRLSTRSGGFNNILDLKTFFKEPILLLPELQYKVNGGSFPINDEAYFFIQYQYKNEEIPKQLRINKDSLIIINRAELFKVDGNPIAGEQTSGHQLVYYNGSGTVAICPLLLNLANPEIVKMEVDVLVEALKMDKTKPDKMADEVSAYLYENYAKVDAFNTKRWIQLK